MSQASGASGKAKLIKLLVGGLVLAFGYIALGGPLPEALGNHAVIQKIQDIGQTAISQTERRLSDTLNRCPGDSTMGVSLWPDQLMNGPLGDQVRGKLSNVHGLKTSDGVKHLLLCSNGLPMAGSGSYVLLVTGAFDAAQVGQRVVDQQGSPPWRREELEDMVVWSPTTRHTGWLGAVAVTDDGDLVLGNDKGVLWYAEHLAGGEGLTDDDPIDDAVGQVQSDAPLVVVQTARLPNTDLSALFLSAMLGFLGESPWALSADLSGHVDLQLSLAHRGNIEEVRSALSGLVALARLAMQGQIQQRMGDPSLTMQERQSIQRASTRLQEAFREPEISDLGEDPSGGGQRYRVRVQVDLDPGDPTLWKVASP